MRIFLALLLLSFSASATPVAQWTKEWKEGKALADWELYQWVYKHTTDREIVFHKQAADEDGVVALYEAKYKWDGDPVVQKGVAVFWVKEEKVHYVDMFLLEEEHWDLALGGQLADIASTGIAIGQGFTEANPIGQTPSGLVALIALKIGASYASSHMNMGECIQMKQGLSGFGWGAATWNLAVVAGANPVLGVVLALVAGWQTSGREPALKACALAKLAHEDAK